MLWFPDIFSGISKAFWKENSLTDTDPVGQFFHLLDTVKMPLGCCVTEAGEQEYTLYQVCYHGSVCRYTTYENRQITAVELHREKLDGPQLVAYPMIRTQQIALQNQRDE